MLSIDRHPTPRRLRSFGSLLAVFAPVFGALLWWRVGRVEAGAAVWLAGGVLTAIYWLVPGSRRLIFVVWAYAAFPIGWTVSHVLMALIFYLVVTPIGWLVRAAGHDPLRRGFDPSARTYWVPHARSGDVGRYFKQY